MRTLLALLALATSTTTSSIGNAPPYYLSNNEVAAMRKLPVLGRELLLMRRVNAVVNTRLRAESDQDQYRASDKWVMNPSSGAGDCEDYALTKYDMLRRYGIDITRMRIMAVHLPNNDWHAVLEVKTVDGRVWVLDNLQAMVKTPLELKHAGYVFYWE